MPIYIELLPINIPGGIPKCDLYLWGEDNYSPVDDFLCSLNKSRLGDFNRLYVLFEKMVERGKIYNSSHFKDVEGHKPLFEFKGHSVRIYCFQDGLDWVLVECDGDKKSDNSRHRNKQCITRAENRQMLYWQEKRAGRLEVKK